MKLSQSLGRKLAITVVAAGGLLLLYEATALDSRFFTPGEPVGDPKPPAPGARLLFSATAYCKGTITASGVKVRSGILAADPQLLPVGSVVQLDAPGNDVDGIYTVMDTGPLVKGRHVDVYMWSCNEALRFGRRAVRVEVLRLGWSPANSAPGLIDRLFRRREAQRRQPAPEADETPAAAPAATPPTAPALPADELSPGDSSTPSERTEPEVDPPSP